MPALAALRRRFPEAHLHLVGNAAAGPIVVAAHLADQFTAFDASTVASLFTRAGPEPSLGPIDLAIGWLADPDGLVARNLGQLGAARVVIAPSRPTDAAPVHVADYLVSTLSPLGVVPGDRLAPWALDLPREALDGAEAILTGHSLLDRSFGVIHPGSGSPAKNWPLANFAEVAARLPSDLGLRVLLVVGPAESDEVAPLPSRIRMSVSVVSNVPLAILAALLSRAVVYVGNDSGPTHLAAAVGCPTVALFGPTDPAVWAPRGPRVRILRREPLAALPAGSVLTAARDLVNVP